MNNQQANLYERRQILLSEFQSSDNNGMVYTAEELLKFLDERGKKVYDRIIAEQLFEMCGSSDKINIEDFINNFIETEDTLNFRIQLDKSKIKELNMRKERLNMDMNQNQRNNESHILVQIMEASNLQPLTPEGSIDAFVKIICGKETEETAVISGSKNPNWNESFDFPIKQGDVEEIKFIVTDKERQAKGQEIGFMRVSLQELTDQHIQDRNDHLMRADGLRTRAKLHVLLKYIYSQSKISEEEVKKINEEISNLEAQIKDNEMFLNELKGPFSRLQNKLNSYKPNQIDMFKSQNNFHLPFDNNIFPKLNNNLKNDNASVPQDLDFLRISDKEQQLKEQVQQRLSGLVTDWPKVQSLMYCVYGILIILIILQRPIFLDLSLCLCFLLQIINERLNQFQLRGISFILLLSWVIDLIWLIMFTSGWFEIAGAIQAENKSKKFSLFLSYLLFFYKIPLFLATWKNSIDFDESRKKFVQYLSRGKQPQPLLP